jgi:hypothetical protein
MERDVSAIRRAGDQQVARDHRPLTCKFDIPAAGIAWHGHAAVMSSLPICGRAVWGRGRLAYWVGVCSVRAMTIPITRANTGAAIEASRQDPVRATPTHQIQAVNMSS